MECVQRAHSMHKVYYFYFLYIQGSDSDSCMYIWHLVDESQIYLILYVDHILIVCNNKAKAKPP